MNHTLTIVFIIKRIIQETCILGSIVLYYISSRTAPSQFPRFRFFPQSAINVNSTWLLHRYNTCDKHMCSFGSNGFRTSDSLDSTTRPLHQRTDMRRHCPTAGDSTRTLHQRTDIRWHCPTAGDSTQTLHQRTDMRWHCPTAGESTKPLHQRTDMRLRSEDRNNLINTLQRKCILERR